MSHEGSKPETIGLQPFPRPAAQRAFAIRLKQHDDFRIHPHTERFLFRQVNSVSQHIYDTFEGGEALFSLDEAAQLAEEAKKIREFTRTQLDRVWLRLEKWLGRTVHKQDRTATEIKAGIIEAESPFLSWTGKDTNFSEEIINAKLDALLKTVRFRLTSDHLS